MMSRQARVLVVGAGPAGLTLAAELARSGVACTVVDKRQDPSTRSRAFGLQPVTLEMLDARGLAERLLKEGIAWPAAPVGDGVRWLPFDDLPTRFPYMLIIPQTDTERILAEWALDSGVTLRRGATLERLTDTGDEVVAGLRSAGDGAEEETRWDYVAGCDGVRSTVRTLAGIGFRGRDYPDSLVVADVRLSRPPAQRVVGLSVPRGMIALFPFPDGTYRVVVEDNLRMSVPVEEPVSQAELLDSMHAVLGGDYGLSEILWASRYRSRQRQADAYRRGRVLLAGDAGHTHIPSGGQGLQLGIADAINLGWKLAAVATGRAGDALLDTYQEERRPLAAGILRKTDLLYRFNTASSPPARALRWIGVKAATLPFVRSQVVRELSGLDVVYPSMRRRGDHALVGRRYPDTLVAPASVAGNGDGDGEAVRMAEMLRAGRGVLIDGGGPAGRVLIDGGERAGRAGPGWADQVEVCVPRGPQPLPRGASALIRPDGFTCWIGRDPFIGSARSAGG
ncbi:FAD-dependent oxidoreductase [Nonomuraea typhae]|uniref:FAD-dependent oxidoreductase n=1 Tax=Nonomuraea typhae TaxID=2603600 RepID=A0ABW7ZBM4_9ACTN